MDQNQSAAHPPGNIYSDGSQDPLAERLQLLEARIRMPTVPKHLQQGQVQNPEDPTHDDVSMLTTLESPTLSQHSFHFDPPSNSSFKKVTSDHTVSMHSPKPSTGPSSPSSAKRQSISLVAVNRAAEQHMQKVAALENSRSSSRLSGGVPSCFSNTSFETLKTSHANTFNNDNRVVKESPPVAIVSRVNNVPGNPRALSVTSSNVANNKARSNSVLSKTGKRKSTPTKKDISSSSRPRKHPGNSNTSNATDNTRKRTRLQFLGTDDNEQQDQTKLLPIATTSNNSRSPKNQKAASKNRLIDDFFTTVRTAGAGAAPSQGKVTSKQKKTDKTPSTPPSTKNATTDQHTQEAPTPTKQIAQLQQSCRHWEQLCQEKEAQLKAVASSRSVLHTAVQGALRQKEIELTETNESYSSYRDRVNTVLEGLMRQQALREAQRLREQLAADGSRLGRVVFARAGYRSVESWEDGPASHQLEERRGKLLAQQSKLEERKAKAQAAARAFSQREDQNKENKSSATSEAGDCVEGIVISTKLDALEAVESVQLHIKALQLKLDELQEQEKLLKEEKVEHIQAWKRLTNEDSSRFKHRPKLHNRYVLMSLLGKGGFSEVWRAYDVEELQEVAVKIHQLDPRWSENKKEMYTKHVSREYEIHRNVRHPRIVSLLDVFEVDMNSFCTVLEFCDGTDLETVLKRRIKLAEREARAILLQILSGMNYLSQPSADGSRQAIIHYDLKPGNILFGEQGDAKITDFGLSKIVEAQDPGQSMELTSQGAGTYWYLPPECFIMDEDVTVKISNKVDVWSIGVIFYQMLYGKRPFGHGQSQDRILTNNVMLNAKEVVFPTEPHVSPAAQAFIRDCLQYDQALRPSVGQICENSYVTTNDSILRHLD